MTGGAQGLVDGDVIPAVGGAISGAYPGGLLVKGVMLVVRDRKHRDKTGVMSGSVVVGVQKISRIVGQQRRLVGNCP